MPTYPTPGPVDVAIDVEVADVTVTASDRTDAVVDVRPTDASHGPDVRAAEQVTVELVAGRLLVRAPRSRRVVRFGPVGSIQVRVEVPAGSQVQGEGAAATFRCAGPLADCRLKTGAGTFEIESAGNVDLTSGAGSIVVDRSSGAVDIKTGSGPVRVGSAGGRAAIRSANGDSWIGRAGGEVRIQTANGNVTVDSAAGDLVARTAHGDVRVGEVRRGTSSLKSAMGRIEVGVLAGTAAHLDVHTHFGSVRSDLDAADGPAASDAIVAIEARTGFGDIIIHRVPAPAGATEPPGEAQSQGSRRTR